MKLCVVALGLCLSIGSSIAQDPPKPVPETPRQQPPKTPEAEKPVVLELGKTLPRAFELPDIDGNIHRSADFEGKVVVIDFWSTTCPISRGWEARLAAIRGEYAAKDVVFLFVNSNEGNGEIADQEPETEKDKPYQKVRNYLADHELPYTVLVDHQSRIADLFAARTTPDVYVFDTKGVLVYRGAIDDDSSGRKGEKATQYLRPTLDQLLAGEAVEPRQTESVGCAIKRPASSAGGQRRRRRG